MKKQFGSNHKNLGGVFILAAFAFFICFTGVAQAQSALDGFDPNANGAVRVVVVQPDGKILIGGEFTTLSPNGGAAVTRNHIARLNADGTLDTTFDPNANNFVLSIAVQTDGKILAGGTFTNIGGQTRNSITRLDAVTGSADSFDPNANGFVQGIAVQTDGKILAGGAFTTIGGQTRSRIARLDAVTGLADSFDPNANSFVRSIVVQTDGKILAGGEFTNIGGQTRNNIARLDAVTGMADSFDPNANGFVRSIAVQADGRVVAGGGFTSIGGQSRNSIARLDAVTGLADSFNPNADNVIRAVVVQADGRILAGGDFTSIGGQTRNNIARLDPVTGVADSFDPNANAGSSIRSIAVQSDGKVLAGGLFTTVAPNSGATVTRNNIVRLETDGRLDQTLNLSIVGSYVLAIAVQPDGKTLIGGHFTSVLGVTRNGFARLNTDGTLDATFNTPPTVGNAAAIAVQADGKILVGGQSLLAKLNPDGTLDPAFNANPNSSVAAIVVQADGKILVGGAFSDVGSGPSIGGQVRNHIARLDPTTGLADSFDPNAIGPVNSIAVQADGKILVIGDFDPGTNGTITIGGQARKSIVRLDPTTGLADSFNPNPNGYARSIAVQPDGKILVGGAFRDNPSFPGPSIGGKTRTHIARLDPATGLADSFDPNAGGLDGEVTSIAVQADGKILAGGNFTTMDGQTRNHIARLDPTTGFPDSFDPNANPAATQTTQVVIAVQPDGKILVGGIFTSIGGQPRSNFARLSNDTAALQNLAVTQTTITWTRGGSSPQFARVTFESSTDNLNYTPLGNGTASGSNWTLTGLSLSTGQNIYIRARGYYRGGYFDGSGSIAESVRNAFLLAPVNVSVSGRVTTPDGRGLRNAAVKIIDQNNLVRTATTSSFGFYSFDNVATGQSYTIRISSRLYRFAPRVVQVTDNLTNVDFVGLE